MEPGDEIAPNGAHERISQIDGKIIERNVSSEGRSDIGIHEARSLNLRFVQDI